MVNLWIFEKIGGFKVIFFFDEVKIKMAAVTSIFQSFTMFELIRAILSVKFNEEITDQSKSRS